MQRPLGAETAKAACKSGCVLRASLGTSQGHQEPAVKVPWVGVQPHCCQSQAQESCWCAMASAKALPTHEDQPSDKPVPVPSLDVFFSLDRETAPSQLPVAFPAVLLFIPCCRC